MREDSILCVRGNNLTSVRGSTGHQEDKQKTKRCADEEAEPSLRENELPVREGEQQNVRNHRPWGEWGKSWKRRMNAVVGGVWVWARD